MEPVYNLADLSAETPRRTRRTKEEMEAARSASGDVAPEELKLRKPKSMAKELNVFISDINSMLLMLPVTRDDALTQPEAEHLVNGWDSAQMVDPKLRKFTYRIVSSSGRFSLASAVIGIAVTRLIRHNIIPMPDGVKQQLEQMRAEQGMQYNPNVVQQVPLEDVNISPNGQTPSMAGMYE